MSSDPVPKKAIKTRLGPAVYTGSVNATGSPQGFGSWEIVEGSSKGSVYVGMLTDGKRDGFGKVCIAVL